MAKKLPKIIKEIRKYKPRDTDYRFEKTISYSQMSMFRSCNHKWQLQYKEGNYLYQSSAENQMCMSVGANQPKPRKHKPISPRPALPQSKTGTPITIEVDANTIAICMAAEAISY